MDKLRDAFVRIAKTDDGKKVLKALYNITDFAPITDAEFNGLRNAASILNLNLEEEVNKVPIPAPPAPTPTVVK